MTIGERDRGAPASRPLLQPLWDAELRFLLWVQDARRRLPPLVRAVAEALTSSHPGRDVSAAVWLATVPALWYLGPTLMWLLAANIALSFALAWTVGRTVAVPADVDARLRARGRVSPTGFPCVELHMAVVLFAAALLRYPSSGLAAGAVLTVSVLVVLRLYALTHFPSQLLASVALGAAVVPALQAGAAATWPRGVPGDVHLLGGVALGSAFLAYAAYRAEENGAPFLRVRKRECECGERDWIREFTRAACGGGSFRPYPRPFPLPRRHAPAARHVQTSAPSVRPRCGPQNSRSGKRSGGQRPAPCPRGATRPRGRPAGRRPRCTRPPSPPHHETRSCPCWRRCKSSVNGGRGPSA